MTLPEMAKQRRVWQQMYRLHVVCRPPANINDFIDLHLHIKSVLSICCTSKRVVEQCLCFHIDAHPEITSRKNWPNKTQQMRDLWQQLREELNCCRGPKRNVAKWKEMLCVWKSQLHARARRLKINQRLTDGVPSLKPMSDFEKKALTTFASAAAMSIERFYLKTHDYLTVERTTSPTGTASCSGSPRALCSPLVIPSNNGQSAISLNSEPSAPSPCPSVDLENQDASTSRLSRSERNELINTLIADIAKRYGAEERQRIENDRRQEHRE